jgi:hypothetical protein
MSQRARRRPHRCHGIAGGGAACPNEAMGAVTAVPLGAMRPQAGAPSAPTGPWDFSPGWSPKGGTPGTRALSTRLPFRAACRAAAVGPAPGRRRVSRRLPSAPTRPWYLSPGWSPKGRTPGTAVVWIVLFPSVSGVSGRMDEHRRKGADVGIRSPPPEGGHDKKKADPAQGLPSPRPRTSRSKGI